MPKTDTAPPPIVPVILCGGTGTRLWPSSRASLPKQFLPLTGPHTPFQETLARLSRPCFAPPICLTAEPFRFLVRDQAQAAGVEAPRIVVEPEARNTAPAVAIAALCHDTAPDTLLFITPSDHAVGRPDALLAAIRAGTEAARDGRIVVFGAPPVRAETGYGHIAVDTPAEDGRPQPARAFIEKPDRVRAEAMSADGRYLWNCGMILATAGTLIGALARHAPDLLAPCRAALAGSEADLEFERLAADAFKRAPAISFDHAVLEHSDSVTVVPCNLDWADLGNWGSIWAEGPDVGNGVATFGPVTAIDCRDSYLRCDDEGMRLVGLGLKDTIAVATRDAVLVADRSHAQEVRAVVAALRAQNDPSADVAPRVHRPWGWYEVLCAGERFQVKRIEVRPGGRLSLQSHLHRSEHWVVVAGTARITVGADVRLVGENQSVYVPLGAPHRLENPGLVPVVLIEVQTGSYLGEDDIRRYDDAYRRG